MKNLFESFSSRKVNQLETENVAVTQQDSAPLDQGKNPKTLKDVIQATESVAFLEEKKQELIATHRDTVSELKGLNVNEKKVGSIGRSGTFNEVLGPIEREIMNIAEEISNLREDNDIVQKPKEILRKRIKRLNELLYLNIRDFLSTETGESYLNIAKENELELNLDTAMKYSKLIIEYNESNGQDIKDRTEFESFKDRDMRIIKVIENIESRLAGMGIRE